MVNCLSGGKHHVREEFYHVARVRQGRKTPKTNAEFPMFARAAGVWAKKTHSPI